MTPGLCRTAAPVMGVGTAVPPRVQRSTVWMPVALSKVSLNWFDGSIVTRWLPYDVIVA